MKINHFKFLFLALLLPLTPAAAQEFLDPDVAFKLAVTAQEKTVTLRYTIAKGYYLYREQQQISAEPAAAIGQVSLPVGAKKHDENFNKTVESWRDTVEIIIPRSASANSFVLSVRSQGCADAGICYPPQTQRFTINGASVAPLLEKVSTAPLPLGLSSEPPPVLLKPLAAPQAVEAPANLSWGYALSFFGLGLLLAFTPCMFPMIPILASIIVGKTPQPAAKSLALGGAYLLGMSVVYTALGLAAGLAGKGLAFALQSPWALGFMALLMIVLALALFGVYELRLPNSLANKLNAQGVGLSGGRFGSVFLMGALAAVVVSPCVSAPLAAALAAIAQRGEVVTGGVALFLLSIGMGLPLVLVTVFGAQFLPKAGNWMGTLQRLMGFALLAVAIWVAQSLLGDTLLAIACAVWLVALASFIFYKLPRLFAAPVALLLAAWAVFILFSVARGQPSLTAPLAALNSGAQATKPSFIKVSSRAALQEKLTQAAAAGKPVFLDFYADWCVSCKEMERFTFTDSAVAQSLARFERLQIDVTANSAEDQALLKQFNLFGPPAMIFYDAKGQQQNTKTLMGFVKAAPFNAHLEGI